MSTRPYLAPAELAAQYLPVDTTFECLAGLLEHAATALAGRCIYDSTTIVPELLEIAANLREAAELRDLDVQVDLSDLDVQVDLSDLDVQVDLSDLDVQVDLSDLLDQEVQS